MAKIATKMTTAIAKKDVTARIRKYSLSTSEAYVDACAGKMGMADNIGLRATLRGRARFATPHQQNEAGHQCHGDHASQPDQIHHDHTVPSRFGVVVKAVEQQLVDLRADGALARFDERQPQLLRRVLDAVEVAREPAIRRHDEHAAHVGELVVALIPLVAEAGRLRGAADFRFGPGEEMP